MKEPGDRMIRAQRDHTVRRPSCKTRHLDLKLPLREDGMIGEPTK